VVAPNVGVSISAEPATGYEVCHVFVPVQGCGDAGTKFVTHATRRLMSMTRGRRYATTRRLGCSSSRAAVTVVCRSHAALRLGGRHPARRSYSFLAAYRSQGERWCTLTLASLPSRASPPLA
jgi:hypothetical protein